MTSKNTGIPPDTIRKQFLDSFAALKTFLASTMHAEDTKMVIGILSIPTIRNVKDADMLLHDIGSTVEDIIFGKGTARTKCIRLRIVQLSLTTYETLFHKFFPLAPTNLHRLFEDLSECIDNFRIWYTVWLTPEDHEYAMVEDLVALAQDDQDKDTEPMCTPIDERCDPLEAFMNQSGPRHRTVAVDVSLADFK